MKRRSAIGNAVFRDVARCATQDVPEVLAVNACELRILRVPISTEAPPIPLRNNRDNARIGETMENDRRAVGSSRVGRGMRMHLSNRSDETAIRPLPHAVALPRYHRRLSRE
jgi:hypothetical protein